MSPRFFPAAALGGVVLLYVLASNNLPFGYYVDDTRWVMLAEQFLRGSVARAWSPEALAETSSAWGLSVLLLPLVGLLGRSVIALKLAATGFLLGGLLLVYQTTAHFFSRPFRWAYGALLLVNGFTLSYAGHVMSDLAYLFLFGLVLWLAFEKKLLRQGSLGAFGVLALAVSLLALTRVLGAVAGLGLLLELVRRRDWKRARILTGLGILVLLPSLLVYGGSSVESSFYSATWSRRWAEAGVWSSALNNFFYYVKGLCCLTVLHAPSFLPRALWVKIILSLSLSGLVLWGLWKDRGSALSNFLTLYFMAYGAVCVLWSYHSPRYILPLFPIFVFWLLRGLEATVPERFRVRAAVLVAALALGSNGAPVMRTLQDSWNGSLVLPQAPYRWLADNSAPEDRVLSSEIPRVHFFSGRQGYFFLPGESGEAFLEEARRRKVRFIFIRDSTFSHAAQGVSDRVQGQHRRLQGITQTELGGQLVYGDEGEKVRIYKLPS